MTPEKRTFVGKGVDIQQRRLRLLKHTGTWLVSRPQLDERDNPDANCQPAVRGWEGAARLKPKYPYGCGCPKSNCGESLLKVATDAASHRN